MKLALTWYYCGLGLLCLSPIMIIWGIVAGEIPLIAKGASGLLFGFWWYKIGVGKIQKAKLEEFEKTKQLGFAGSFEQFEQIKQLGAFQKENCVGCRFADEEAMRKGQKWCIHSESPEFSKDNKWCYSRERKQ